MDYKVPTEIILDKNNDVIAFGVECFRYINSKELEDFCYFKGISRLLYEKKKKIKAINKDTELPLELIIQKVLEIIKWLAIKDISKFRPFLIKQTEKIKWVITIPSFFGEYQKEIMWKSCEGAGLINKYTDIASFFILESEAISIYCIFNKEINKKYLKKGSYYIVCKLGKEIGDIVAHLVGTNNADNEISPIYGGIFGSDEINKLIFKEIIFELFGCHNFYTFYLKYKKYNKEENFEEEERELSFDWLEFEREIKDFMENATFEKIEKEEKFLIDCTLFKDIFDINKVDISDLVKQYNEKVNENELKLLIRKSKNKWIIEFPYAIIYHYMKKKADSICKIINDISKKEKIEGIIFVGVLSYNEIILKLIQNGLNDIKSYLRPSRPCLTIIEGAVLYGIQIQNLNMVNNKQKF